MGHHTPPAAATWSGSPLSLPRLLWWPSNWCPHFCPCPCSLCSTQSQMILLKYYTEQETRFTKGSPFTQSQAEGILMLLLILHPLPRPPWWSHLRAVAYTVHSAWNVLFPRYAFGWHPTPCNLCSNLTFSVKAFLNEELLNSTFHIPFITLLFFSLALNTIKIPYKFNTMKLPIFEIAYTNGNVIGVNLVFFFFVLLVVSLPL